MFIREGLTFDDVLLVPGYSDIVSRSHVDLSVTLPKGFVVSHPVIPANMKTITGYGMADFIYLSGGLAILHRFMPFDEQLEIAKTLKGKEEGRVWIEDLRAPLDHIGFSIGVKKEDIERADRLVDAGVRILCIDVAHGDSESCVEMCKQISSKHPDVLLIAGNIATDSGALRLWEAGADMVKVGVGPGSLCTTRIETGNGVPQLSALIDVSRAAEARRRQYPDRHFGIIADGGIKSAGDIVKALCFADMVMAGNVFAGTNETPGRIRSMNGQMYKEYVGSSTHKTNHIEGVEALVPQKGPAEDVLTKLLEGVSSGCSYQGVHNLVELKENPQFIKITGAGLRESHPHDVILK